MSPPKPKPVKGLQCPECNEQLYAVPNMWCMTLPKKKYITHFHNECSFEMYLTERVFNRGFEYETT